MREVGRRQATRRERKGKSYCLVGDTDKSPTFSLPQSASLTAPSSEGALVLSKPSVRYTIIYCCVRRRNISYLVSHITYLENKNISYLISKEYLVSIKRVWNGTQAVPYKKFSAAPDGTGEVF